MKPSVTIPEKSQIIGSLGEPGFHDHFRPQSNQYMHQHTNTQLIHPNQPWTVTGCSIMVSKIISIRSQVLGPIKLPLTASFSSNIDKVLKEGINPSREKPLPLGVCQNFSNPVPTRSPLCVEQLPFLFRRLPTVGLPDILERSDTLSL